MIEPGFLGGICANIDIETGKFFGGRILNGNNMEPYNIHPYTDEIIEDYNLIGVT